MSIKFSVRAIHYPFQLKVILTEIERFYFELERTKTYGSHEVTDSKLAILSSTFAGK